jgi:Flp pilus assembly protein TadD
MELTIKQALQQGIAAHKEAKLEEAERLYRAILQSQPAHPDANHNLGVLAVSVNKAEAALPLFKTALEANPKIEQYWLSYIDALIKEKQFENVKLVIEQAKTQGVAEEKLNILETQLTPTAQVYEPKLAVQNKSLSLSQKRKKLSEQKKRKKKVTKQNLKTNNPSQQQLDNLLEHYQNGRFGDAEKLSVEITQYFPKHQFAWKVLGAVLGATGRKSEAADANQKAVSLSPQDAEAHSNLGITLQELGRLDEAEASYTQAIALKPNFAEAHYNLGITLQELGRFEEAEASYTQAIALKPDYAKAHNNLGNTLKELGRLDEAEASYTQAIALKPDFAQAHSNLGIILYGKGDIDSGIDSFEKANDIDPKEKTTQIVLPVLRARDARKNAKVNIADIKQSVNNMELIPNPLILHRSVEPELVANLYEINTRELDETTDERFGNGKTTDWNLFDDNLFIMGKVVEDLISIIKKAFNSDIFIADSFFNILSAGSGSSPHAHLNALDKNIGLNLASQKHVFQYYLRVGDQSCSEPGIYKLYEPNEEILPSEGMVIIIPAGRRHSAVYDGKTDRVMIGINFYTL